MNESFISYSRKDLDFVLRLVEALKAHSFDPWFDLEDLPPAIPWQPEMLMGVQFCDSLIFVISPDSLASNPCAQELACALRHNKRLIPIIYRTPGDAEIHPALSELNWIFFHDFQRGLESLLKVLRLPPERMGELCDRTEARVLVYQSDGRKRPPLALHRNCYWIGRALPPDEVAGAIILKDSSLFISRRHAILKAIDKRWHLEDCSRNSLVSTEPKAKDGFLTSGTKIFVGSGNVLIYEEFEKVVQPVEEPDDNPTIT
jgi:hypothetical protein